MKFKLGKSKITNFVCHKNFQGKKKELEILAKHWQILDTVVEFTLEKQKIPPFFLTKISGKKKTLENLAKHWKILDTLVEFTLKSKKNSPPFFLSQRFLGKKN
jgi:sulfur relay (sulfurtransferase) DsrC/TusE family protein